MADIVSVMPIFTGWGVNSFKLTSISDGTGESDVTKIIPGSYLTGNGTPGVKIGIVEVVWSITGFSSVELQWDYSTSIVAGLMSGNGAVSYAGVGKLYPAGGTGGTGNLSITSRGALAGATYDITIITYMV